jgi:parallel beta helix pectate lyase-like protein
MTSRFRCLSMFFSVAAIAVLHVPSPGVGATLQVGADKPFKTVRAAAQVAQNGDLVLIDAGVYSGDVTSWNASNLTVRGVGGRPHMKANGAEEAGKGTWVVNGNNFTAENIEFSGSVVPDGNGAGIRTDTSGYLVVRNCYFHDNQNGILGGVDSMLIERCTFDHNGTGDGRTHNMYIWGRSVTVRYTYTHRAVEGHNIKTRGQNNYILYNRIMDESDGTASYSIDVPDCGRTYVIGNVIEQGPNSGNSSIVAYGAESSSNTQDLYVINNTIVNNRTAGGTFIQINGGTPAKVMNNILYGPGTPWSGGIVTPANNFISTALDNSPRFSSPSTYDFHLTAASPANVVNAGAVPGVSVTGYTLMPLREYVYDAQDRARTTVGALDLGAFESGAGSDASPPRPISDLGAR